MALLPKKLQTVAFDKKTLFEKSKILFTFELDSSVHPQIVRQ